MSEEEYDVVLGEAAVTLEAVDESVIFDVLSGLWREVDPVVDEAVVIFRDDGAATVFEGELVGEATEVLMVSDEMGELWEEMDPAVGEAAVEFDMRDDCVADVEGVIDDPVVVFDGTEYASELDPSVLTRPLVLIDDAAEMLVLEFVVEEVIEGDTELSEVLIVDKLELLADTPVEVGVTLEELAEILEV